MKSCIQWHQKPGTPNSHYDICLSMRDQVVKLGAVEITWMQAGRMTMNRRKTGTLGQVPDIRVKPLLFV